MSDLIHHLEYLKIPHPLEKERSIIKGEDFEAQKTLQGIYGAYRNRRHNLPRLERKLILPTGENSAKLRDEVRGYEKNLKKNSQGQLYLKIFKNCARLGVAFSISYLIWSLPPLFMAIDRAVSLIGDWLSPYAAAVITIAPSIVAVYSHFFGVKSFSRLKRMGQPLELYDKFGKSTVSRFISDLRDLKRNIAAKLKKPHRVIDELESIIQMMKKSDEWKEESFKEALQRLLDEAGEDPDFPWGEKNNLKEMVEDVLYHWKNRFRFAPLKVTFPLPGEKETPLALEEKKAKQLAAFLNDERAIRIRDEIIDKYQSLKKVDGSEDRIKLVSEISQGFQRLIFLVSQYDLGETSNHYDRGKILKNLYHHFYVSFGKIANILRKKKLEGFRARRLIATLENEVSTFLNTEVKPLKYFLLRLGVSKLGGITVSLAILAATMSLMGFQFLREDQFLVVHQYKFGYRGLMGERVSVESFADKAILEIPRVGKLFWYFPKPFVFTHKKAYGQTYETNVFVILEETRPKNLLDKFLHFFKKDLGTGFTGLNLKFKYRIKDPLNWGKYDYDGRGSERLSRDLEGYLVEYMNKTKQTYREKLYREKAGELRSYLDECFRNGKVTEWIRRFVYPSIFDTYRFGSTYEKYAMGLNWLKDHPRMEAELEWKEFVEHEIKNLEKLTRHENEELISQPMLIKRMMRSPSQPQLQEYENLYRTISYLAMEDYINHQILQEVQTLSSEGEGELTRGILPWIHENSKLEKLLGIRIEVVESSILNMSTLRWQNEMQRRRNLI